MASGSVIEISAGPVRKANFSHPSSRPWKCWKVPDLPYTEGREPSEDTRQTSKAD
jgi:hypothetical protein